MTKHYRKAASHTLIRSLTAWLIFSLSSAAMGDTVASPEATPPIPLHPYRAEYQISHNGLSTVAKRELARRGEHWVLSQNARIFFLKVDEEALIETTDSGLRPLRYDYENSVSSKRNQRIRFDWQRNTVADKKARKPWSFELKDNYTDQLSSQLQLRQQLLAGSFDDNGHIEQTIISNGKIKTYRIEKLGEESVETALGNFDTVKLRRHREGSSSETFIWMAPELNFLIVKMEQVEDDDNFSLEILKADIRPALAQQW